MKTRPDDFAVGVKTMVVAWRGKLAAGVRAGFAHAQLSYPRHIVVKRGVIFNL